MKRHTIFPILCILVIATLSCSVFTPSGNNANPPVPAGTERPSPSPTFELRTEGSTACRDPNEPVFITGDIPYTSPFFLNSIAEPFVMLEDEAGFVKRDKEFRFALQGQTIGPVEVDKDQKLTYYLALPSVPQGTMVDVDNNGKNDEGVQVFAVAYWSNTWGDPFLEERDGKGWSNAYTSAITDPENDNEIIGGTLIVWAPDDLQGFPTSFGADGKLFTADDPTAPIPPGYSLVNLDEQPFRIYKEATPQITLIEGAGAVKDYSEMKYADAFETLFQKASREYPFTKEKNLDWEAIYQELKPRFDKARSKEDFYLALRDFANSIPDGHVGVSFDRDVFFELYGGGLGLVLELLSDQRIIAKEVLPGKPAEKAGLQRGAELLSWNGEPVLEAVKKVVPGFGPYSTDHARLLGQVNFLSRMPPGSEVALKFKNPDSDEEQSTNLKSVAEYDSLFLTLPSFNQDELALPIEAKTLESGLVYLRINTFSDDYNMMARLWERYIQTIVDNDAPGVIIDLRVNSGGSLGLAMDFAGYFFDKEVTLYDNYYYNENTGQFESTGYPTKIQPADLQYKGKIAVLVSADCISACEGFAFALQQNGRSKVIGHYPTAGAFGEVGLGQYNLPDDFSMQFPTGRPENSDGAVVIEGKGVIPDVLVPVTLDSALGKLDAVLEAALKALQ